MMLIRLKGLFVIEGIKVRLFLFLFLFTTEINIDPCWAAAASSAKVRDTSPTADASPQKMRFKLGFEFQEISGLCPWALYDTKVQKKPLFWMIKYNPETGSKRRLWHVVIDTTDIEFVTEPFSDEDGAMLKVCIETLSASFRILQNLLTGQKGITFRDWIDAITREVTGSDQTYKVVFEPENTQLLERLITRPTEEWIPEFAPQVTIQHPLEWTIPLYFALFGFDSIDMASFCASLPFRDLLLKALKEGDSLTSNAILSSYRKKLNGLVFLHALTLLGMCPRVDEDNDTKALQKTAELLKSSHQIDAKMKLSLMSRRPFFRMYQEIKEELGVGSYEDYFEKTVLNSNKRFANSFEVPTLFSKTNYGEQYIDPATKYPISLEERIIPLFEEDFLNKNREILIQLLGQGVITTTMIRHIKTETFKSLMDDYFEEALNISKSVFQHYELGFWSSFTNLPSFFLKKWKNSHDTLSPPWFLSSDDSMGRFKDPIPIDERVYGEAIIEARNISNVSDWFLTKAGLSVGTNKGMFLTAINRFSLEAKCLFDFLNMFTSDYFSDINKGIIHAIKNN